MKKRVILACLLALVCLFFGCNKEGAAEPSKPLFDNFSTMDIQGNIVDQKIFADHKLTMVNIWATFCSPCIQEMPDLATLNKAFGKDFQVVGIVIDTADRNGNIIAGKKQEALSIIDETGADYLHLLPSISLNKAYLSNVQSVPQTVFVDSAGRQVGKTYIGAKSYGQWKNIIADLLDELS